MQPTIICTAPAPGLIYLNGRFAGEASADRPLFAPVSPGGPVYLEYRPLTGTGGALARKLVMSGGAPLADSLAEAEGLDCVSWPGGALEAEFTPPVHRAECFALEGMPCTLERSEAAVLSLNGMEIALPAGAKVPTLLRTPGAAALLGDVDGGGQYLASLTADLASCTGLLTADRLDIAGNGMVSAIVSLGDSVGHGRLEQWLLDQNGLNRLSSQPAWSAGAPRWPDTAEGTMIAAVEAALAGLPDEAGGYLTPSLAASGPLDAIGRICDGCLPMRYGIPDGRDCVGLLSAENAHLATVRPLYYRAEPSGGAQGPWKITHISIQ